METKSKTIANLRAFDEWLGSCEIENPINPVAVTKKRLIEYPS
jgi:hypothetical protein